MSVVVLLKMRDRHGREWTAPAIMAEIRTGSEAPLALDSAEAKALDLRVTDIKVVEQ